MENQQGGALETAKNLGMIAATPAEMKGQILALFDSKRRGFEEGIKPGELTIPRIKMLQGLSVEVQQDPKNFYAGLVINSITKEKVGDTFIPIRRLPNSWVRFNARKPEDPNFVKDVPAGAIIWRSNDPKDPRVIEETKFGENGEAPKAITFLNFLVYSEGQTLPFVLSFGKTSYRAGQDFLTMAFGFGGDMYSRKYKIAAKQVTNPKGTFYVWQITPAGKTTADEIEIGNTLFEAFAGVDVKAHEEDEEPGSAG
jgi:hypothetical protein